MQFKFPHKEKEIKRDRMKAQGGGGKCKTCGKMNCKEHGLGGGSGDEDLAGMINKATERQEKGEKKYGSTEYHKREAEKLRAQRRHRENVEDYDKHESKKEENSEHLKTAFKKADSRGVDALLQERKKMGQGGGMDKTMHEFKAGDLHSGSKKGPVVKSRKQAIAIGMNS